MSNKVTIHIAGLDITVAEKFVSGNTIRMNHVAAANAVKQYVKARFPEVVVSAKSDSFSMGNSVDVYLSDEFGQPVDREISKDVQAFGDLFVYGKFDGMTDMYEYTRKDFAVGSYVIDPSVKYLTVQNRAQHGSVADTVRMLIDMTTTERYNFGMISLEEAIIQARRFGASQANIDKAMKIYSKAISENVNV